MTNRSFLTIGIILTCLFYLVGDTFTLVSYYQMVNMEDESVMDFGPSPFMFYSFCILFILKIVFLLKARNVSEYLLPVTEESTLRLSIDDICMIIGIIICIVEIPDLIISIIKYKNQVKELDNPYPAFNEKLDIYESSIRLLVAFILIYLRKDILKKLNVSKTA
jgi:hypothetical protein